MRSRRFLDYVLNFITFEDHGGGKAGIAKKAAGYHQYHAVNQALASTLIACGIQGDPNALYARFIEAEATDPFSVKEPSAEHATRFGDRRGVIWHTRLGQEPSMVFYAGKVIRHPAMENPTVVVITDRNDLDDQLFVPSPQISNFCGKHQCRRKAVSICGTVAGGLRWRDFHHHPEVLSR